MTPFFVGWNPHNARPHAGFLLSVCLGFLLLSAGLALALGETPNDPGDGDFAGDYDVLGTIVAQPYPMLVTDAGHTIVLSGGGKRGAQAMADPLDGKRARVKGGAFKRGTLDMLMVWEMAPADGPVVPVSVQPLGTWRLTGEICDGKCVSGVMRPGQGLAHKACANVCVSGGVPPVLSTTAPVEGARFLLMGDAAGNALPDGFRDQTALLRRMDGAVIRVGDMLVFRTDLAKAVVP